MTRALGTYIKYAYLQLTSQWNLSCKYYTVCNQFSTLHKWYPNTCLSNLQSYFSSSVFCLFLFSIYVISLPIEYQTFTGEMLKRNLQLLHFTKIEEQNKYLNFKEKCCTPIMYYIQSYTYTAEVAWDCDFIVLLLRDPPPPPADE